MKFTLSKRNQSRLSFIFKYCPQYIWYGELAHYAFLHYVSIMHFCIMHLITHFSTRADILYKHIRHQHYKYLVSKLCHLYEKEPEAHRLGTLQSLPKIENLELTLSASWPSRLTNKPFGRIVYFVMATHDTTDAYLKLSTVGLNMHSLSKHRPP